MKNLKEKEGESKPAVVQQLLEKTTLKYYTKNKM